MSHASLAQQGGFYDEITIIGSKENISRIPGSAHYIGPEQLEDFSYSDIQRIAREIPGVSIQVEDGYGLRPNISIRGVSSERSSRITLLEDNVLIAPAPYAAPAAYYFPTAGRIHAFEVVKGPAAITQGPNTIGGALNMASTPIPDTRAGNLLLEGGEDATYRLLGSYGGQTASGFGFLLETHQWQSDGFQDIDRSGTDTGLDVQDYTLKLAYAPSASKHAVELKLQYTEQDSNQSYLGLSDADFEQDPFRRYGLSALDNIATEHEQQILRYEYRATDALKLTATAYNNKHKRNWFKTEGVDLDGSSSADTMTRVSWADIVADINHGRTRDGVSADMLAGILHGDIDTPENSITLRANNREYYSRGGQLGVDWLFQTGAFSHSLQGGLRYHRDQEDRFQFDSGYQQLGGELVLNSVGAPGGAGNEKSDAQALAVHLYDLIEVGNWTFTPGLRYEDIELKRTRFSGGQARDFRDSRKNTVRVWLPGGGLSYRVSNELTLLGGVHKGFSAPTNAPGINEEKALNYELGLRFRNAFFSTEIIGFLSDYDNLLGVCTASSGVDCEIGDAFNGDAVTIKGVEFLLNSDLSTTTAFSIPLQVSYTYSDGEFDTDIADTAFFGEVSAGDPIPYLPDNQFRLSLGLENRIWGLNLSASYVDAVCVVASCGDFEQTDSMLTLDLSGNYQATKFLNVYARIENLTAQDGIAGRQPFGARPNKDRTAALGVRMKF
ncbi:MAG: TonB-dependent receptor [Pseudomonadales bacterium]|nr:TonB-dependent receptor [Pseudomonadales bacterium]